MRVSTLVLAALAAVPFEVACDFETIADSSDRYREDFQYSYNLKPGGRVSVDSFNGSIEVLSWEKNAVQITGAKYAAREEDLKDIKIEIKADEGSVQIRTVRPEYRRGNMGAKYFLRVPQRVELETIHTSNGHIRVEDIEGNVRLETSNGSIRMRKVHGRVDAKTSNGAIEGDDVAGETTVRTSNGTIRMDRVQGGIEASTSNGSIHVVVSKPKPGQPLRFESSNGSLDLTLAELANNEVRATTNNSSITLRVPASIKAQLRASTSNSSITSDLDVVTRGTIGKNHLEGEINGGGALIQLSTSNGSIKVLKQ
ncbi:MAG: DUF4097 family beta strand repeat-containing protein [Bryobacteraceae bacterium]|jgi:DUF4097 and DUF4098 domain-containing protein YvlB